MAATWRQTAGPTVTSGTADGAATGPWVPAGVTDAERVAFTFSRGLFPGTPPAPSAGPEALRWARSCRQPHGGSGNGTSREARDEQGRDREPQPSSGGGGAGAGGCGARRAGGV